MSPSINATSVRTIDATDAQILVSRQSGSASAGWERRMGPGFVVHVDRRPVGRFEFADSVARGLDARPRFLESRYLYDDRGSEIFERITEQPEYYLTRTEDALLSAHAPDIRARTGDVTLVEIGAGSCTKTRHLLEVWSARGEARFVPIDISSGMLASACQDVTARYPGISVEGIAASSERALPLIGPSSPLLLLFLGSTVGNFDHATIDQSLAKIGRHLAPGDWLLLGVDLIKETGRIEAAYNDEAGWSAQFTLNLFARMNRELGTGIPLDAVEHVALYNREKERIEIYAQFLRDVDVVLPSIGREFRIESQEMILTETSYKFRVDDVAREAEQLGLKLERAFTDRDDLYGLLLFRREAK